MEEKNDDFENPIHKDKVAEKPGLLPYAHHVGSAIIRPIDEGRIKGESMKAMYQQTEIQLDQIRTQVEALIQQAQEIHERIEISERIYTAECKYKPVIGQTNTLYQRKDGTMLLSLIARDDWGKNPPFVYIAEVVLLADRTWHITHKA